MSDRRAAQALRSRALPASLTTIPTSHAVPRLADVCASDRSWRLSSKALGMGVQALEACLAFSVMIAIASKAVASSPQDGTWGGFVVLLGATLVLSVLLAKLGLYAKTSLLAPAASLPRLACAIALVAAGLGLAEAYLGGGASLAQVVLWGLAMLALLSGLRWPLARIVLKLNRANRLSRRAVIYGTGQDCTKLIQALEADVLSDIRIAAVFDERGIERTQTDILGYPRRGGLAKLIAFCRSTRVDVVILALPMQAEPRVLDLLERLSELPCDIKLAPMSSKLRFAPRTYSYLGSVPLIDLAQKPISGLGQWAKTGLDVTVAALALIVLSPLMLGVALAVRLTSKGPAIFRQKRYGFNNELIEVWKFRSMFIEQTDAKASQLVTKADPRVTPVGRFIRKTSIDELPQLFNVLFGTLSLVGPRPHALAAKAGGQQYDQVVARYFARHKVKPGITGWAQINGWRGETQTVDEIERRVACDLHYIENWSLRLDTYILLMTPLALLDTSHAY